jgi:hypothetical protein
LAALEDVMRRCSGFWNGVGSLLVPVRADGRLPRWLDVLLEARGIDQCFIHEALSEQASESVRERCQVTRYFCVQRCNPNYASTYWSPGHLRKALGEHEQK